MSQQDFDAAVDEDFDDFDEAPKKTKKKSDSFLLDGVCDGCGNSGLIGDTCPLCGGIFQDLSVGLEDENLDDEPETYPLDMLDEEEGNGRKQGDLDEEGF